MNVLKRKIISCLLCCLLGTNLSFSLENRTAQIVDLRCEYAANPIGIDVQSPRLSWRIESGKRGVMQQSYRILVATSEENLAADSADVWDSGKIKSSASIVEYAGQQLTSRSRYFWKVQTELNNNTKSEWSHPAIFEMGLLNPRDWLTGWITYAAGMPGRVLYYKSIFHKDKPLKQARMYISGLGYYELHINGKKVGQNVLEPAQSTYDKRIYYTTYDITDFFSEKVNTILASVAPGWYGLPSLRIQMEVEETDGNRLQLSSDAFRHVTTGPTVYSTVFDGECYDARLNTAKLNGTDTLPPVMDKEWAFAYNTVDPGSNMVASNVEPIQIVDTIVPASIAEPQPGVYVVDAGRNLAGWSELRVQGKEGTKITLRFAETCYESGLVNQENLRNARVTDTYILSGKGVETWHPAFTYHGFRYVQVDGFPYKPKKGDITIHVVRSAVAQTGRFSCSNPLLNDIHRMVFNTEASNLHSVPTDCPQRDERMGWLNDLTVRIEQAVYNFNMSRFYAKFIDDVADTQDEEGRITCVAPFRFGTRPADPVCASYLLMAWKCYEFYGDRRIIAEHYEGMKAWTDYLYSRTDNGIVDYSYYGDWCPPVEFGLGGGPISRDTPGKMISTGYLYYCATLLSEMAEITGNKVDVVKYREMAEKTGEAFNREYWDEQAGGYASNNQASNAFALYMGLVSEKNVARVAANLAENVKQHGYHLTTGNLCTKYLLEMLTEHGYHETAYKIAAQTTYPSWGFMLSKGATTLFERWEYTTGDGMNSHNHPMMGSVGSWFYKYVAGIRPDVRHPGFEQFVIRPYIFNDLDQAEGELDTVKGLIKSGWSKKNGILTMNITIPDNTIATVYVPAKSAKTITESGRNISKIREIKLLNEENGVVAMEVGSGIYQFTTKI